jgi:hypothetical protein
METVIESLVPTSATWSETRDTEKFAGDTKD